MGVTFTKNFTPWSDGLVAGVLAVAGAVGTPDLVAGTVEDPTEIKLAAIQGVTMALCHFIGTTQDGLDNIVSILGQNTLTGGLPNDDALHQLYDQWEHSFLTGGIRLGERHWQFISADASWTRRMLSAHVRPADSAWAPQIYVSGELYCLDKTGAVQLFKVYDGGGFGIAEVPSGGFLNFNNTALLTFKDGGGTIRAAMYAVTNTLVVKAIHADGVEFRSFDDTAKIKANNTGIGFFASTPVAKQASGANLTNNVTSGGTDDTIANFTDLTTYSNSAAAIRNDIYQLARKLKQVNDALRLYGLLT